MDKHTEEYFNKIFSFESFREVWDHYGYGSDLQDLIQQEFFRIKGTTYLDHAGTTLYPESLIKGFYQDLSGNVYGNPHSHHLSSRLTHDTVERVRFRILQHFNTCPEDYTVVFTSGCTAALKLVAESFPWRKASTEGPGSQFCYLTDNHTSVVGIRGLTSHLGVVSLPVAPKEVESRAKGGTLLPRSEASRTLHLFCYPAQSNFSGSKYPLSYIEGIRSRSLYPACDTEGSWFVLLDAACFVTCSPLDLQAHPADFVSISFYKMFGFPTGLGALLVRNKSASVLRKTYFGGGTSAAYLAGEDYYVPKPSTPSRFEDGTVSFLDIVALHHGFESFQRITGSMERVQLHTFGLARHTYTLLSCLCHGNGQPVARIYCDNDYQDHCTQGAILNFNLLDEQGAVVGYSQVDKLASLFSIQIRTGCFCNTGACQHFLGITNLEIKSNLQAGHICGDNVDLIEGRPTGSVRVSFGYMSTFQDCQSFLKFIVKCFVQGQVRIDEARLARLRSAFSAKNPPVPTPNSMTQNDKVVLSPVPKIITSKAKARTETTMDNTSTRILTNIFLYPIKSCAAVEVREWPLGPLGLLYDRLWMIVNQNGVCLSQKQDLRLCLIRPQVDWATGELHIHATGMTPISVPLDATTEQCLTHKVCQSKVCGDRVQTMDCGDAVAVWLSEFLGKPCRLIRQSPDFSRDMKKSLGTGDLPVSLSLVNEAQFLMINKASVELLQFHIISRSVNSAGEDSGLDFKSLIDRFRANLVVSGTEAFEEDDWMYLMIGDGRFQVAGRCGRCQMIGIDQSTGARTQEPLRSLSACREGKLTFGVYLFHQPLGSSDCICTLSVGSPITPEQNLTSRRDYT